MGNADDDSQTEIPNSTEPVEDDEYDASGSSEEDQSPQDGADDSNSFREVVVEAAEA